MNEKALSMAKKVIKWVEEKIELMTENDNDEQIWKKLGIYIIEMNILLEKPDRDDKAKVFLLNFWQIDRNAVN